MQVSTQNVCAIIILEDKSLFENRGNAMIGIALIVIMSSLMGLMAFASLDASIFAGAAPAPSATMVPFAERLEEAGSIDALMAEATDGWVPVAPGVDFQRFRLADPNNVHVARMDRTNLGVFIESSIGQGRLSGGLEPVTSQFQRYEGALNYWGEAWGQTNNILVAINGSFFTPDGVPDRGVIHSGWYAKRFTDNQNGSGFVWKLNRTAFVGQCVRHDGAKQVITYLKYFDPADPVASQQKYQGINTPRGADEIIVYTSQYDRSTKTDSSGVEILVELVKPKLVIPLPNYVEGKVIQIRDEKGDTSIPFDHVVISGSSGSKRLKLLENLQVGDLVGFSSALKHYSDDDCTTPAPGDWSKAYAAVGGSFYFLENGVINTFSDGGANVRSPRTAIAFNDQYIFFIVVDGRDEGVSIGMNMAQLGAFARDTLGATHGINQDGGGSSTMVVDGVLMNTPSDLTEVPCPAIYFPIATKPKKNSSPAELPAEAQEIQETGAEEPAAELKCYKHVERWVSNGMMMVAATPQAMSFNFSETQSVQTAGPTDVYLGPGTNYALLTTVPGGTSGTIMPHANNLNGVYAKGTYWWKVNFNNGVKGWVAEPSLVAGP